jgi:hypothetical protein
MPRCAAALLLFCPEGQGSSRKLSITLCKQRAATGQRYAVWGSLLQQEDTVKPRTQQLDQQSQL